MSSESANGKPRRGRWKPGQSGNPSGRRTGQKSRMREAIEAALNEPRAGYMTVDDVIARKLTTLAEAGDLKAIELLMKRTWPEKLELGVDEQANDLARDILEARRRAVEMRKK